MSYLLLVCLSIRFSSSSISSLFYSGLHDDGSGDGLPTGAFVSVEGTPRDLREDGKSLAQIIQDQARLSPHWPHGEEFVVTANRGVDCNAVAAASEHSLPPFAAKLSHPPSGRCLHVHTSEPALQVSMHVLPRHHLFD